VDWACAKVSASGSTPDEELRDALRAKLADQAGGVRYAAIAAHAQGLGRPRLATLLLEHETRAGEQVGVVYIGPSGPIYTTTVGPLERPPDHLAM